jgi:hypothetical protein
MLKDVKTEQVDGTIEIDEWVFGENKMASDDPWDEIIDGYVRLKLNYKLHLENETRDIDLTRRVQFHEGDSQKLDPVIIWGWDGDKENPTLDPSIGCDSLEDGWLVHIFIRDGDIDPCSDMALDPA